MIDATEALAVLREVASIPTAPLHEEDVATYVRRYLDRLGLARRIDAYGNLFATYQKGASDHPLALVAHLDHPALEITAVDPSGTTEARLLGGVPSACFDRPAPMRVITGAGEVKATIVSYLPDPATGRPASLQLQANGPVRVGDFAVFDLPSFEQSGDQVSLRVADDLAGVAAVLLTLKNLVEGGIEGMVHAVFTRAEEIGLIGAILVAEEKALPPETIVVSLECSRELPGAQPGLGPVIRVGDRTRSFSPEGEAVLLAARDALPDVPIQRQLMSGGTCEATAFGLRGYRTTGVALPLVNYHNVGPGNQIAPERIDFRDFLGEVRLLTVAAELSPRPITLGAERRFAAQTSLYRDRLHATADRFRGG